MALANTKFIATTEASLLYTFLAPILLFLLTLKLFYSWLKQPKNLPPSPPSIPILGHLHLVKLPLHRAVHCLSQYYGPVSSVRLGSRRVVIVSSAKAAEECYTKNDIVLANRPSNVATKHLCYDSTDIVSASYGDHWRNLCRICNLEIFSSSRLNSFFPIRRDEIKRLLLNLNKRSSSSGDNFTRVELNSIFMEMTFNIIVRILVGKRYYGEDVANAEEALSFREMMSQILKHIYGVYPGDFLSILRLVLRGYEKNVCRLGKRWDQFLQNLIEEHRDSRKKGDKESGNTVVDHLLSLQDSQPEYYTDKIIKGLMQDMLIAGTETSTLTLEWAMTYLLHHPYALNKAAEELDNAVGRECLINETDIAKLPYLQNIISETLRLKPPAALLVPHMSSEDCTIGGYNVPSQTIVVISAWTIHRDPELWDDPRSFKPERFENGDDRQYKFLPFGHGRRACPGANMAQQMISLALGSLIQCFEWQKIGEEGMDARIVVASEAMCRPREIMARVAEH